MCCSVLGHVVVAVHGCVWLSLAVVFTLCVVVCGCSASWRVVFCVGTRWVPRVASTFALFCCAVCRCVRVLGCLFCGVRFCVSRCGWFGVGFRYVVFCVVARAVLWRVVLSFCVLVRWVGRWCVASGIVLRCCTLLLVGFSRCIACSVAHRCLVVGCGLVFLVDGFAVVCYVSALHGVVVFVLLVVPHCCAM